VFDKTHSKLHFWKCGNYDANIDVNNNNNNNNNNNTLNKALQETNSGKDGTNRWVMYTTSASEGMLSWPIACNIPERSIKQEKI
jgi:hypothetical protein